MNTAPPISRRRRVVTAVGDVTAVLLMLGVVIAGFAPSFSSPAYLVPAVCGALLGTAIAVVAAWRRFGVLLTAVLTVAAYFLVGGALALPATTLSGIPTIQTLGALAAGAVTSWKRFLTTPTPALLDDGHGLVPCILLLVTSVIAVSLALRLRWGGWTLLPVVAALLLGAALGVPDPAFPVAQGVVFAVVAVAWLGVRHALDPSKHLVTLHSEATDAHRHDARNRRALTGAAVIAVAALAGGLTGGSVVSDAPRAVLRDVVTPPLRLHEYVSPLQSFRHFVRDKIEQAQFTIADMPRGSRVRLATLDAYSGTVLDVSGVDGSASSHFGLLRRDMAEGVAGDRATIRVEVGDYADVWVPTVGIVQNLTFGGAAGDEIRRATYMNEDTQTVVNTDGIAIGDRYTLDVVIPKAPAQSALESAAFADVATPRQRNVPNGFAEIASKATADAETPYEKVNALATMLIADGYFSHGLKDAASLPGHGAARLSEFLEADVIVGDDEQYAVTMALLADQLDIPIRVVMGWHATEDHPAPEGDFIADGANLHAWVEVAFDGLGWVPFDVTPPEDKEPQDNSKTPRSDQKPQVLQPPPPPQEPADLPPSVADDRDDEDGDKPDNADIGAWVYVLAGTGAGLLVLLAPILIIAAVKASRRRRRVRSPEPADRISGGWDEVVDRAVDLRVTVPAGATRAETAQVVADAFQAVPVRALAQSADVRVFGPSEPTDDEVRRFWNEVDQVIHGMGTATTRWSRMRAKISLRSLLGRRGRQTPRPSEHPEDDPAAEVKRP